MNILEQEIEDLIFKAIENDRELLKKRGFPVFPGYTYTRQPIIANYGRADLIGYKVNPKRAGQRVVNIEIIELKKDRITASTFFQAIRYAKGIQHFIDIHDNIHFEFEFRLIGKSIDTESDFIYLPDIIENVWLYTYQLDLQTGLTFRSHGSYSLSDPGKLNNQYNPFLMAKFNLEQWFDKNQPIDDLPF